MRGVYKKVCACYQPPTAGPGTLRATSSSVHGLQEVHAMGLCRCCKRCCLKVAPFSPAKHASLTCSWCSSVRWHLPQLHLPGRLSPRRWPST
jgi:hypothetical protein